MEPVIKDIVGPFDGEHTPCALNVVMITINSVGELFLGANRFQIGRLGPKDFKSQDLGKIVRERYLIYRLGMGYISTCYLCRDLPNHRMLICIFAYWADHQFII